MLSGDLPAATFRRNARGCSLLSTITIDKQFIVNGAAVIATMPIGPRIKPGDAELAARDLLGIFNESHVAWQKVKNEAFGADATLAELADADKRRARREEIVTLMVEEYLRTR